MNISLDNIKLAIIGLGYIGLPLAVEFAKKRPVVGFDINQNRIDELRGGHDRTKLNTLIDAIQKAMRWYLPFTDNKK